MITNKEANQSPFVLKYNQTGDVILIRASGPAGGVIQGSIQQTNAGKSFLVAGTGISIVSSSLGQVTVSATGVSTPSGPAGGDLGGTYPNPTVTDLTIAGQSSGDILYYDGSSWVTLNVGSAGDHLVVDGAGFPSWTPGASTPSGPAGGDLGGTYPNPTVTDLTMTGESTGDILYYNGSNWVTLNPGNENYHLKISSGIPAWLPNDFDDSIVATLSGSRFHGNITVPGTGSFEQGISGSLTRLTDGRSYLVQGSGINITSQSNGQVTIASTAISAIYADVSASYIVVGLTSSLPNERNLTAGSGISMVDGGAGGPFTVSVNDSVVATVSGTLFQANIETVGTGSFRSGISGSLTRLTNGTSYLVQGSGIIITSQSNGQVLVSVNDSIVATVSGTRFTGNITVDGTGSFVQGISGSLTRLVDGTSYLVAGTNITIVSQSNGQVTISSTASSNAISSSGWYDSGSQLFTTSSVYIGIGARSLAGSDANFFVSGVIGSRGSSVSGSTVFGGDVFVSGTLYASRSISGSLTRLVDGTSYLVAGTNVTIATSSTGQVTINVPNIAQESLNIVVNPSEVSGTIETIVGSIFVPATSFSSARAMLGSTGIHDSGSLRIRRFTTSEIILTLGGLTGNLADQTSTSSVLFPIEDWYDIYLFNSSISGSVLCNGLKLVGNDSPKEKTINFIPSSKTVSGTIETIVGSIYLRSGTFSSVIAMLGAESVNDTGALRIRRFTDSSLVVTMTGSGSLRHVATTGSVPFPTTDWYDFLLYNSSVSGSALCNGVKLIG